MSKHYITRDDLHEFRIVLVEELKEQLSYPGMIRSGKHIAGFLNRVMQDEVLNPSHVSLYLALFQSWMDQQFKNPITISREELMRSSRVNSRTTYHRCLRNLHHQGYIQYFPSFDPYRGSSVVMFEFEK